MPKTNNSHANEKADLREYLLHTHDFWGQYRNQKENAAWVATTVYLGALLAIDSFVVQNKSSCFSELLLRDAVSLLVLVSGYLTWRFIGKQNTDRKFASNLISACEDVLADLFNLNALSKGSLETKIFEDQ